MDFQESLCNQLLIAMPGLADPNFNSTVTLVCEHNAVGALGIVLNRPMDMDLGGLLQQLDIDEPDHPIVREPVVSGGPVARERGFVLHDSDQKYESSVQVSDDLQLTLSRDVIDAMATGKGPGRSLIALGYAGWEAGQLEAEMLANTWLTVPATSEVIFEVPFSDRWHVAASTIGIDMSRVSQDVGHA